MRSSLVLLFLIFMSSLSIADQAAAFVTDPKQITSPRKAGVQSFDLEKLYLTRSIGESDW